MSSPLAYVVANPSKPAATGTLRRRLDAALQTAGYQVRHLLTTPQSPGKLQARQALDAGAGLVVVAGGDGTLRCVAGELANTTVPMGILPLGTANLAARSLGIPVGGRRAQIEAIKLLCGKGRTQPVDLGWVRTDLAAGTWHPCLTVSGMGFDADLVASTRSRLKGHAGWLAYAVAALGNLHGPRLDFELSLSGSPGTSTSTSTSTSLPPERLRARTVLVANGGRLPAKIDLLPQARMDDGVLDVAAIDVRGSLAGWSNLAAQVLLPQAGWRERPRLSSIRTRRGSAVVLHCERPVAVQVDGDLLPPTECLQMRIDPAALQVLLPNSGASTRSTL
ncbi:Diacylglycerol kinase [Actinomyces bovis]|uniref:Diacylglycerol kinase n=1 Tax=Actinomyces bovis TaxID=1658 RepID=A0ABY1VNP0_9ACTO|nr:diacylglycerol kinase family protein [Actinomyces bovis]SPT53734.1 Diacylglycerol kinase [Actinomyces bovis]VEG55910.1 Diacylglycerol kinase [Actinomyces israelii]